MILEGKGSLVRVEEPDEYNLGEVVLGTVEAGEPTTLESCLHVSTYLCTAEQ